MMKFFIVGIFLNVIAGIIGCKAEMKLETDYGSGFYFYGWIIGYITGLLTIVPYLIK